MSLLQPPRLPEIDPHARIASPRTIAVVDTLPGAPIVPHLASTPGAIRARLLVRHKPGFDLQTETSAAAHPDALLEAARALLASLPKHALVIAEGPALLACLTPSFAVLGTLSPSLTALDPDVRALRDRFDLVLFDHRPRVLDALVRSV